MPVVAPKFNRATTTALAMTNHPGWYPPGQVCYPPELPPSFKNVHDLKPIIGVPTDEEMIGIHAVIHAANRVSGVPGMHDPSLYMKLADHLFDAQMARYRSKYSLITFPSDATYNPPALPAHMPVNLESVSGSPSDKEIMKAQDAVQSYQELRRFPSMFDPHLSMELSQHLFNIQMARHMRVAGEMQPSIISQDQTTTATPSTTEDTIKTTNNAGTGARPAGVQSASGTDVCELMERSNQLSEQLTRLLERSNELIERGNQSGDSGTLIERFSQVFERFTQSLEQTPHPTAKSDGLTEKFSQLFERFNQLVEQLHQPARRANELAERSNELAEEAGKSTDKMGELMKNINRVLMGIQHAIVRSRKDNTIYAVDCLVNEEGKTPREALGKTFYWQSEHATSHVSNFLPIQIGSVAQDPRMYNVWLGRYLHFYGIGEGLRENATSTTLKTGKEKEAREMLSDYLSSCLG